MSLSKLRAKNRARLARFATKRRVQGMALRSYWLSERARINLEAIARAKQCNLSQALNQMLEISGP